MNQNRIITRAFSNPESEKKYHSLWEDEPDLRDNFYYKGRQCGGCSFYAVFDEDWGLCCHKKSRHHLETVFEHFTCPVQVNEGWDAHSFIDFNATPELRKWLQLQFAIPEDVYDRAQKVAEERGDEVYMVILEVLWQEFGKNASINKENSAGDK
jgi:hypothetical protein